MSRNWGLPLSHEAHSASEAPCAGVAKNNTARTLENAAGSRVLKSVSMRLVTSPPMLCAMNTTTSYLENTPSSRRCCKVLTAISSMLEAERMGVER